MNRDDLNIIKCPACGEEMEQVPVADAGVIVDVCTKGCGGIYFDNREFKLFDEQHENISAIEKALEGKTFKSVDQSVTRQCPVCGANMVKNYTGASRKIEIDECYACGGKFFDYGELQALRAEYTTEVERAKDAVNKMYSDIINKSYGETSDGSLCYEYSKTKTSYAQMKKNPSILTKIIDMFTYK